MKRKAFDYIDLNKNDLIKFAASLIKARPVNPYFVNEKYSEEKVQEIIKNKLEELGLDVYMVPVDFKLLEKYKNLPGYTPGVTDTVSFDNRPNIVARLPGTNPKNARSLLLSGHCDVVAAEDPESWEHPPFAGVVSDGMLHGRGASDMLSGLAGMIYAIESIIKTGHRPEGDIWFSSIICEEFGGTGTLAVADWMNRNNIQPDVAIMGEPTSAKDISLICRGITFADIVVTGRAGHLEKTPKHWTEGGAVDAIEKARYIMKQLDLLNEDWALRKDKDHPLINDPCQVKVALIKGGHHPSSYAEKCVISIDIQSLPHEQNENGIPVSVREDFEEFLMSVCESDSWLRENPVEVIWKMDADCVEISKDHEFVKLLSQNINKINGGGDFIGISGHYDGGWFDKLNGTKCVCFGPGDMACAHARNEACSVNEIIEYTKIVASSALDWSNNVNNTTFKK